MFSRIFFPILAAAAGMLGGILAAAQAQGGRTVPSVIEAKSFVLLDGAGRKRGEWKLDASGQPFITLFDENGRSIWSTAPGIRAVPLSK